MRLLVLLFAFAAAAIPCSAQDSPSNPFATARVRFGPLALNPTFSITDVGVDTNVFNTWDNPRRDFTATINPGTQIFFRAGRTRLTGVGNLHYQFFRQYVQERYWGGDTLLRFDVDLLHIRPYATVSYNNTRQRPGFEVDARARRFEQTYAAGANMPLSRRITVGVSASHTKQWFAADAVFLGTYLRDAFDRTENAVQGSLQYRLTPLTTLLVDAERQVARFTYTPSRNSNSLRIVPGVEFDAFAIIQGSARIGYRKMDFLNSLVPGYSGPVASVSLGYTLAGMTRFGIDIGRDAYWSFDLAHPYFVQTGATFSITQKVGGPFDVQARAGAQRLRYVWLPGEAISESTDKVALYGGGIGYRLGKTARLGVNVDSYKRQSQLYNRDYQGLRVGSAVTYGF